MRRPHRPTERCLHQPNLCLRALLFVALAMWAALPHPAVAQPTVPLGSQFQVNTYTSSQQLVPAVAAAADGDLVVVWHSLGSAGTDTDSDSILGQRYASDGTALGAELQVNTYTTLSQRNARVAAESNGDFVVVWESTRSISESDPSIQGQRYASNGTALGGQFQVNTFTTSSQIGPAVAMDADGDFVVAWESDGGTGDDFSFTTVAARRYASDGSPIGGEFQVNTHTTGYQNHCDVAMDADGDFIIVWESDGSSGTDTSGESILGQRYSSSGAASGGEFQVNTYTTGMQSRPAVAMDVAGNFTVAWTSLGSSGGDDDGGSIQALRFASGGTEIGSQFQVNTYTTNDQDRVAVAVDGDGHFVVAWASDGSYNGDGDGWSAQARHYAADGSEIGTEFLVNSLTADDQTRPMVSMDFDGDTLVAWQSLGSVGDDSSDSSIQGQRFGCTDDFIDNIASVFVEDDDTCPLANGMVLGIRYVHFHCDVDWFDWNAVAGTNYLVETSHLGGGADTTLSLHLGCGPEIDFDDDGGAGLASRIYFTAAVTGTYSVAAREFSDLYTDGEEFSVKVIEVLFFDDFESGNTTAWSSTSP